MDIGSVNENARNNDEGVGEERLSHEKKDAEKEQAVDNEDSNMDTDNIKQCTPSHVEGLDEELRQEKNKIEEEQTATTKRDVVRDDIEIDIGTIQQGACNQDEVAEEERKQENITEEKQGATNEHDTADGKEIETATSPTKEDTLPEDEEIAEEERGRENNRTEKKRASLDEPEIVISKVTISDDGVAAEENRRQDKLETEKEHGATNKQEHGATNKQDILEDEAGMDIGSAQEDQLETEKEHGATNKQDILEDEAGMDIGSVREEMGDSVEVKVDTIKMDVHSDETAEGEHGQEKQKNDKEQATTKEQDVREGSRREDTDSTCGIPSDEGAEEKCQPTNHEAEKEQAAANKKDTVEDEEDTIKPHCLNDDEGLAEEARGQDNKGAEKERASVEKPEQVEECKQKEQELDKKDVSTNKQGTVEGEEVEIKAGIENQSFLNNDERAEKESREERHVDENEQTTTTEQDVTEGEKVEMDTRAEQMNVPNDDEEIAEEERRPGKTEAEKEHHTVIEKEIVDDEEVEIVDMDTGSMKEGTLNNDEGLAEEERRQEKWKAEKEQAAINEQEIVDGEEAEADAGYIKQGGLNNDKGADEKGKQEQDKDDTEQLATNENDRVARETPATPKSDADDDDWSPMVESEEEKVVNKLQPKPSEHQQDVIVQAKSHRKSSAEDDARIWLDTVSERRRLYRKAPIESRDHEGLLRTLEKAAEALLKAGQTEEAEALADECSTLNRKFGTAKDQVAQHDTDESSESERVTEDAYGSGEVAIESALRAAVDAAVVQYPVETSDVCESRSQLPVSLVEQDIEDEEKTIHDESLASNETQEVQFEGRIEEERSGIGKDIGSHADVQEGDAVEAVGRKRLRHSDTLEQSDEQILSRKQPRPNPAQHIDSVICCQRGEIGAAVGICHGGKETGLWVDDVVSGSTGKVYCGHCWGEFEAISVNRAKLCMRSPEACCGQIGDALWQDLESGGVYCAGCWLDFDTMGLVAHAQESGVQSMSPPRSEPSSQSSPSIVVVDEGTELPADAPQATNTYNIDKPKAAGKEKLIKLFRPGGPKATSSAVTTIPRKRDSVNHTVFENTPMSRLERALKAERLKRQRLMENPSAKKAPAPNHRPKLAPPKAATLVNANHFDQERSKRLGGQLPEKVVAITAFPKRAYH